ncbi:MAG: ketoacyl-ACP synthase III [Opitutales bacterium]
MARSRFEEGQIRAVVTSVPATVRRIDDDAELLGNNPAQLERIKKTIGLNERRVVQPTTTTADLCEAAARHLLERATLAVESVDVLICVTQTPDYFQPCNAALLQGKLGLPQTCAAFDVNLGCSGYVYALWLAWLMVNGGGAANVLVLAGDTISRQTHPRDRAVAPLFGDGGSATWVSAGAAGEPVFFDLHTDGTGFGHLIVPGGAFRQPAGPSTQEVVTDAEGNMRRADNLYMNGAEVFNFSIKVEPKAIRELLEFAQTDADAVDAFVFHQANRYIISNIVRRLKVPLEKAPCDVVEKYGNQSSASIPSALCESLGGTLKGATQRLVLSGFGVGLSWASMLAVVGNLECAEVITLADA